MTFDELKKTLNDYFSDTSRPASETKADLLAIADEAAILAESIIVEGGE